MIPAIISKVSLEASSGIFLADFDDIADGIVFFEVFFPEG
jgi:hypothetical protein